jgi:hypothetical protein
MMNRYHEWARRAFGPPQLGFQGDIWRLVPRHPATEWVRNKLTHLRSPASDEEVAYYLNRSLIQDVLHAAGAAEYTANKVYAAAAASRITSRTSCASPGPTGTWWVLSSPIRWSITRTSSGTRS